jgi:hypothetical protein
VNDVFVLFAQNRGGGGGELAGQLIGNLCSLVISLAYLSFVAMSAQKCLAAISAQNRDMEPGMAWLVLIPCFGIIWIIIMAIRISSSLEKEYADRGMRADGDFGKMMGILSIIPCIGFICNIIWVVKIRGYAAQLEGGGGGRKRGRVDDIDDDDDDRPRKKRRRDEDDE